MALLGNVPEERPATAVAAQPASKWDAFFRAPRQLPEAKASSKVVRRPLKGQKVAQVRALCRNQEDVSPLSHSNRGRESDAEQDASSGSKPSASLSPYIVLPLGDGKELSEHLHIEDECAMLAWSALGGGCQATAGHEAAEAEHDEASKSRSAAPSAGTPASIGASSTFPEEEVWEHYLEPGTLRAWYWNPCTDEVLWVDDPDPSWQQFYTESGKRWWWQESTGRYFFEVCSSPPLASASAVECELHALRRENAALRATLRRVDEPRLSSVSLPCGAAKPRRSSHGGEAPIERPAARRSLGAEALRRTSLSCPSVVLSVEGHHWDWPLSRSERKQRLQLAERQLQALEGQELLQEVVAEHDASIQEMAAETEELKGEIAKLLEEEPQLAKRTLGTWHAARRCGA